MCREHDYYFVKKGTGDEINLWKTAGSVTLQGVFGDFADEVVGLTLICEGNTLTEGTKLL